MFVFLDWHKNGSKREMVLYKFSLDDETEHCVFFVFFSLDKEDFSERF